ncbi:hypothetical protein REPUB_Repub20aG0138200 [Reevesia pubescens]
MNGRRIRVNETRFRKPSVRGVNLDPSPYGGKVANQVPRVFPISAGTVKEGVSYRDAVLGKPREGLLPQASEPMPFCEKGTSNDRPQNPAKEVTFDLDIPRSEMQWLSGCAVGRINSSFNLSVIQDTFEEYNINCSMSFMGGISVALLFPSSVEMDNQLKVHRAVFDKFFDDLLPWDNPSALNCIAVWVTLEGVPLQIWHERFFSSLGNSWGSFLKLDCNTILKTRFDLARLLVLVENKGRIPSTVSIYLNGKVFKIYTSIEDVTLESLGDGDGGSDHPSDEDEVSCSEEACMACTNVQSAPRASERYKSYVGREEELLLVFREFPDPLAARVDLVPEELVGGRDFSLSGADPAALPKGNDLVPFYFEDNGFLPVGSSSPFSGKYACVSSNPGGATSSGYGTYNCFNVDSPVGVLASGPESNTSAGLVWDSPSLGSGKEGMSLRGFLLVDFSDYGLSSPGPLNVAEKRVKVGLPIKPLLRAKPKRKKMLANPESQPLRPLCGVMQNSSLQIRKTRRRR